MVSYKVDTPKLHDKEIIQLDPDEVAIMLDYMEECGTNISLHRKAYYQKTIIRKGGSAPMALHYIRKLGIFTLWQMFSVIQMSIPRKSIMRKRVKLGGAKPLLLFLCAKKWNNFTDLILHETATAEGIQLGSFLTMGTALTHSAVRNKNFLQ